MNEAVNQRIEKKYDFMITRWVDPLHETGATTLEPMTRHSESRENSLVFSMCKLMR